MFIDEYVSCKRNLGKRSVIYMHYWDDKQELLKPYGDCSICSICTKCDFTLRDDAKYYVDQLFMIDKRQIKDKNALFGKINNMEKRLRDISDGYDEKRIKQLLYCVCIRYIRKAALETPVVLSKAETARVLNRALNPITPSDANLE